MKIDYLSYFINKNTPIYGGEKTFEVEMRTSIDRGDSSNSSFLHFPNHIGTHIDFPFHFSNNGKRINDYKPNFWIINNVGIVDIPLNKSELITDINLFKFLNPNVEFIIIKTGFYLIRNSDIYWNSNPGIDPGLASKLKSRFPLLRMIGFDFISISSFKNRNLGRKAHYSFLMEYDILIIEDMDLRRTKEPIKRIIVLPLLIDKTDGVPVTILVEYDE